MHGQTSVSNFCLRLSLSLSSPLTSPYSSLPQHTKAYRASPPAYHTSLDHTPACPAGNRPTRASLVTLNLTTLNLTTLNLSGTLPYLGTSCGTTTDLSLPRNVRSAPYHTTLNSTPARLVSPYSNSSYLSQKVRGKQHTKVSKPHLNTRHHGSANYTPALHTTAYLTVPQLTQHHLGTPHSTTRSLDLACPTQRYSSSPDLTQVSPTTRKQERCRPKVSEEGALPLPPACRTIDSHTSTHSTTACHASPIHTEPKPTLAMPKHSTISRFCVDLRARTSSSLRPRSARC